MSEKNLSNDARVILCSMFSILVPNTLQFDRPWIIHPRMRKGLDELTDKGYLTVAPLNDLPDSPLVWKPTQKLYEIDRGEDWDFVMKNSFPVTVEENPEVNFDFVEQKG